MASETAKGLGMAAAGGIVAGSLVATEAGWRPVETLRPGVRVATFGGGLCPVASLTRLSLPAGTVLVHVPGGSLSACADLALLPDQPVLLPTGPAAGVMGEAHAFLRARALVGRFGVGRLVPGAALEVVRVGLATLEALWINTGVLLASEGADDGFYPLLGAQEAEAMLAFAEPVAGRRPLLA
ncbi:MAG: Hint domain-containing protein, partial [Rhodobacteraceae bacterium]|nr:Hint domain-containing protein [Paracoccaceae bacterium]